jgi:hypothetical protein
MNVNGLIDPGDLNAFALGLRSTGAYRAQYYGEFPVTRGSPDSIFDFDDIGWFLEILETGGVAASADDVLAAYAAIPEPSALVLALVALSAASRIRTRSITRRWLNAAR